MTPPRAVNANVFTFPLDAPRTFAEVPSQVSVVPEAVRVRFTLCPSGSTAFTELIAAGAAFVTSTERCSFE